MDRRSAPSSATFLICYTRSALQTSPAAALRTIFLG
jgi:hypothetical protein